MAERLVNVDRDTPMLLPPDLRQWVPEDDLVHFVINAVETMNLSAVNLPRLRGHEVKQYFEGVGHGRHGRQEEEIHKGVQA